MSTEKRKKSNITDENSQVIVVWISPAEHAEVGTVNVVSDNRGEARVYAKDDIDPRCGDCKFVPELGLALAEMSESPGPLNARQIPLTEAIRYGIV